MIYLPYLSVRTLWMAPNIIAHPLNLLDISRTAPTFISSRPSPIAY